MKVLIHSLLNGSNNIYNNTLNVFGKPIIILMYHQVLSENEDDSSLVVTTRNFKNQIDYIRENFDILRFDDDWSHIERPSFVITFDDGYENNYSIAKNYLIKNHIPSTFFITTKFVQEDILFWWDEVALNWDTYKNRTHHSFQEITRKLVRLTNNEREKYLSQFRPYYLSSNLIQHDRYKSMSEQEILELSKSDYITIGGHTVNHISLSFISQNEMRYELEESKKYLERITGKEITTCSYPYGYFNNKVIKICKELGYNKAATTVPRNCYSWTNAMKTPRLEVPDEPIVKFKQRIKKVLGSSFL